jgi:hypothetical protein
MRTRRRSNSPACSRLRLAASCPRRNIGKLATAGEWQHGRAVVREAERSWLASSSPRCNCRRICRSACRRNWSSSVRTSNRLKRANFVSKVKGWTHMTHLASMPSVYIDPRELFLLSPLRPHRRVSWVLRSQECVRSAARCVRGTHVLSWELRRGLGRRTYCGTELVAVSARSRFMPLHVEHSSCRFTRSLQPPRASANM